MGKVPECNISFKQAEEKNPEDPKSMIFSCLVKLNIRDVSGFSVEPQKQMSKQKGCQLFLKDLFPKNMTWNDMLAIVRDQKERLRVIVLEGCK